jgi:hypothetical protein
MVNSNPDQPSGSSEGIKVGKPKVMVRAFEDEPVKLVAVSTKGGTVEVGAEGSPVTIGFPKGYVYEYLPDLYKRLREAWDRRDSVVLKSLWKEASLAKLGQGGTR